MLRSRSNSLLHALSHRAAPGLQRRGFHLILGVFLLSLVFAQPCLAGAAGPSEGTLLIKPRASAAEAHLRAAYDAAAVREVGRFGQIGVRVLRGHAAAAARALAATKLFEFVEADAPVSIAGFAPDPAVANGQAWHLPKIDAATAWGFTALDRNVRVAVLDSGIEASHPELFGRVLPGYDFVSGDDDPRDEHGHGTAVASIIAAQAGNGQGTAGVSLQASILPVRVLDAAGTGSFSTLIAGILYAADNGAQIINISAAAGSSSQALQEAVNYAWERGSIIVAAAGNTGIGYPNYPAACTNVIAVAATDPSDARPAWSSYGTWLDLAAPGTALPAAQRGGGYTLVSGTSFSAPIVAAVLADMAAVNPGLTAPELCDVLLRAVDDVGPKGFDFNSGYGRVNAGRAVATAAAIVVADISAPTARLSAPSVLRDTVAIDASATDNIGVVRLRLTLAGQLVTETTGASLSVRIDSRDFPNGTHVLEVIAVDAAGNQGAARQSVTVDNPTIDQEPPAVSFVRLPPKNGKAETHLQFRASASDNVGVQRLEFRVNGVTLAVAHQAAADFEYKLTGAQKGTLQFEVVALDWSNNAAVSEPIRISR